MNDHAPPFWPRFGVVQHTPALCREPATGHRGRAARDDERAAKKARKGPCPACGSTRAASTIPDHSWAYCPACHSVAPNKQRLAAAHDRGPLDYDRRKGDGRAKQAAKAEAEAKKATRLTAKQKRAMLADAKAGDQPLADVEAFLASLGQAG